MCGIAGWFSEKPKIDEPQEKLQKMITAIKHRGPDGNGVFVSQHVGLAHTRLAIIDIDGGKQPMQTKNGQFTITFNGEIYNYKELRDELISQGCIFDSASDTEVIMQLYQQYGWKGFNRLRGMYAFALWDSKNKIGILVRDPIGIKPLFISTTPDKNLVFGSEAKSILAYKNNSTELDLKALHLLINFRYLPGDRSMFQNISQMEPGTVFVWHTNGQHEMHKLEPEFYSSHNNILDTLTEAIDIHCTSDVEVGSYLSGGIDSAAICALAKRSGRNLRSFTLDCGDDPNEAKNAKATARILNIENICETVPLEISNLSRLVRHLEVPKINAYQVSRLAMHTSKYVKVALSGLGADELFYGYNAHRIFNHSYQINRYIPSQIIHKVANMGNSLIGMASQIQWTESQRALRMLGASKNWPRVYGLLRNVWDTKCMRDIIYGPRMLDSDLPDAFITLEDLWPAHDDPVKSMALFEWKNKMVNDLLWQEDRVSMAEGLEVRVPYVDIKFAKSVASMERNELMPGGELKGYMKQMLSDVLPEKILNRPKSGFQVDAPMFVKNTLMPLVNKWLSPECIVKNGLFNPTFVKNILNQRPKKRLRWHYFMLYQMLLTHIWIAEFEGNK
jgi:asparagine synthase (glutamine-hydrolysing)